MINNVSRQYSETKNKTKNYVKCGKWFTKQSSNHQFVCDVKSAHCMQIYRSFWASLSFLFLIRLTWWKKSNGTIVEFHAFVFCLAFWRFDDFNDVFTCLVDLYSVLLSLFWLSSSHSMNILYFVLIVYDTMYAFDVVVVVVSFWYFLLCLYAHSNVLSKKYS